MRRYEMSDFEWVVIEPHLPNKVRGVARVGQDNSKVLNGHTVAFPNRLALGRCPGALRTLHYHTKHYAPPKTPPAAAKTSTVNALIQ